MNDSLPNPYATGGLPDEPGPPFAPHPCDNRWPRFSLRFMFRAVTGFSVLLALLVGLGLRPEQIAVGIAGSLVGAVAGLAAAGLARLMHSRLR